MSCQYERAPNKSSKRNVPHLFVLSAYARNKTIRIGCGHHMSTYCQTNSNAPACALIFQGRYIVFASRIWFWQELVVHFVLLSLCKKKVKFHLLFTFKTWIVSHWCKMMLGNIKFKKVKAQIECGPKNSLACVKKSVFRRCGTCVLLCGFRIDLLSPC